MRIMGNRGWEKEDGSFLRKLENKELLSLRKLGNEDYGKWGWEKEDGRFL